MDTIPMDPKAEFDNSVRANIGELKANSGLRHDSIEWLRRARTAVREYLASNSDFVVDDDIEAKLLITVAPGGYLRRR